MPTSKQLTILEVESLINKLRNEFRDKISDIAGKCEKDIVVSINLNPRMGNKFADKSNGIHPFEIEIKVDKNEKMFYTLGHKTTIKRSELHNR